MTELETKMKHHDWYFAYSDDHSVWLAGNKNLDEIYAGLKLLSRDEGKILWGKYGKGMKFPEYLYKK